MTTLYVQTYAVTNGTRNSFQTLACEAKDSPMSHHERGLTWTASGYGDRIPTRHMVRFNGKWRRVYCRIYSNIGTCFIGKSLGTGFVVTES